MDNRFNDLKNTKKRALNENPAFAQVRLEDIEHLKRAHLELFMETAQRVGLRDRMPICDVHEIGGYYRVEICTPHTDDGWRFIQLINKYANGEKYPSYITN